MDVGFLRDKKVRLLKTEFGANSVLFVLYVLCKAYEEDGYFLRWDKDEALIAVEELGCGISPSYISEVLKGCLSRSLFDERVFEMFGVLTSAGIQRRYLSGCEKRSDITIINEYWLLDINSKNDVAPSMRDKLAFIDVSGGKNQENSPENPVNSPDKPQSKVKQSKANKTKEKESTLCSEQSIVPTSSNAVVIELPLNDKSLFKVYEDEVREWSELYPIVDVTQELRSMKGWLDSNPSKRKTKAGIKRFINAWLSKKQDKGSGKPYSPTTGAKPVREDGEYKHENDFIKG